MTNDKTWIGADPGGAGKFGVAILHADNYVESIEVNCADDALEWIKLKLGATIPDAAGIDAPLWWSSGLSGLREADKKIRDAYLALEPRNVQAGNSLRGAVLVQGVLFAHLLRKSYPAIGLTETHPKALIRGWGRDNIEGLIAQVTTTVTLDDVKDHMRDALISAVVAREGFSGTWSHDLFCDLPVSELNPSSGWVPPINYFWPEPLPIGTLIR